MSGSLKLKIHLYILDHRVVTNVDPCRLLSQLFWLLSKWILHDWFLLLHVCLCKD